MAKSYHHRGGRVDALTDVDLQIAAGTVTTLIGPSGCGKSTLLRLIVGLEQADSGTIRLPTAFAAAAADVGYMPQNDVLLPWRTVIDNIILPLEVAGVKRRTAREQARSMLVDFGLEGFGDLYPHRLSGGMRQRAAFLRTIIAGNRILLLDEPFGALDALTRTELQNWLSRLQTERRWTMLFVTHDVSEAVYMGDRVMALSPRPGRPILHTAIELPRPRSRDMLATPQFTTTVTLLLHTLGAISA